VVFFAAHRERAAQLELGACGGDVSMILLGGAQSFFEGLIITATFIFFSERSRARISTSVRSGSSATSSSNHCSCFLSGERM
jgi:hypothetical protein